MLRTFVQDTTEHLSWYLEIRITAQLSIFGVQVVALQSYLSTRLFSKV